MKKDYLSPNIHMVSYAEDVIMASGGNGPLGLGDGGFFVMKKHYETPEFSAVNMLVDVILASGDFSGIHLGDNDWGVQDDFV